MKGGRVTDSEFVVGAAEKIPSITNSRTPTTQWHNAEISSGYRAKEKSVEVSKSNSTGYLKKK